jgi:hypothetical protein
VSKTVCKLCQEPFEDPLWGLLTNQKALLDRATKHAQDLANHLKEKHPDEDLVCQSAAESYGNLTRSTYFEIVDEVLIGIVDTMRGMIRRSTTRAYITDEQIRQWLDKFYPAGNPPPSRDEVRKALTNIRDVLQEEGKHRPAGMRKLPQDNGQHGEIRQSKHLTKTTS